MKQDLNIYTVMLMLSFLATLIACLFLYFEFQTYGSRTVPTEFKAPVAPPPGLDALSEPVSEIPQDPTS